MVCALTETWFNIGFHEHHPNPFPLRFCEATKWGLTRKQKSRALQFLIRIQLIEVDRSGPQNPSVTLTWEPRYPATSVTPASHPVTPASRLPS